MSFFRAVIDGVLGGYYAMVACGLSFMFGVMKIINLARTGSEARPQGRQQAHLHASSRRNPPPFAAATKRFSKTVIPPNGRGI